MIPYWLSQWCIYTPINDKNDTLWIQYNDSNEIAMSSMIKMIHFGSNTMTSYTIYWPVCPQPEITQFCPPKSPLSARSMVCTYWFMVMGDSILNTHLSWGLLGGPSQSQPWCCQICLRMCRIVCVELNQYMLKTWRYD